MKYKTYQEEVRGLDERVRLELLDGDGKSARLYELSQLKRDMSMWNMIRAAPLFVLSMGFLGLAIFEVLRSLFRA